MVPGLRKLCVIIGWTFVIPGGALTIAKFVVEYFVLKSLFHEPVMSLHPVQKPAPLRVVGL